MAFSGAEKPYARALFLIAGEHKLPWEFATDLGKVEKLLEKNPELKLALLSPGIAREVKKNILNKLFKKTLYPQVFNLLFLLIDKDRFNLLSQIREAYYKLCLESINQIEAEVESAYPLSEQLKEQLANALAKITEKKVILNLSSNPELIGGCLIYLGDKMIDASLRGQLKKLKEKITQTTALKGEVC